MNWNVYVLRRNVNVEQWLSSRGVNDRDSFVSALASLNIEPPDDEQINSMFPPVVPNAEKGEIYEPANVTSKGSDQASTRSVVSEGDRTNQRSDRKRSTKVRS